VRALTVKVELRVGARYYATVSAMNKALLWSNASSNGLTVDQSAPRMLDIRDGFGDRDVSTQEVTNVLISRWEAEDDESPVFFDTRILGCHVGLVPNGAGRADPKPDVPDGEGGTRKWGCSDCDTRPCTSIPCTRKNRIGNAKIGEDFWVMVDDTWARDRQVYGFADTDGAKTCGPAANETCSKIHLEAGECYYTETRAVNEAGYTSEPMITDGVLVGSSEQAVHPSSPHPVGMMFDAGPADVKVAGGNATNETRGNPASPDTPLVGTFTMPPGAVDEPVCPAWEVSVPL
jgi:hypothetical protein